MNIHFVHKNWQLPFSGVPLSIEIVYGVLVSRQMSG
jgi:hypothetical protein